MSDNVVYESIICDNVVCQRPVCVCHNFVSVRYLCL